MMSSTGSPSLRAHTMIQQNVASIKTRLEAVRSEAVTGVAHDVARAVDGDTGKLSRLTAAIDYAKDRTSVLRFEGDRMATAQGSIESLRGSVSGVIDGMRLGDLAPEAYDNAERAAHAGLSDAVARLNGDFGGRPLFGGDAGGAPLAGADAILDAVRGVMAAAPDTATGLADVQAWFDDPAGGFTADIYQGGDGDAPTVEVAKGSRIATSLRADDPAFRDALRGLAITALAAEAPNDAARSAMLSAGQATLTRGAEGAIALQSQLGVSEERAATALAGHEAEAATLSIAYTNLTGRDQAEAATEMRLLESQLEAAYLTTSRMSNLSLLNFLR